ncbi:DUF397 domain-containing protein [Actinosynnema sp. NPDC023587]|uniref:DUF397 domain-containing protein n=1 Tax=Actinosynnema sp. NPDC023587 TaxID=3154695 RepID=UPI0033E0BC84
MTTWRKASRSNTTSNCVEVARSVGVVAVRDSKNPDGPVLRFPMDSAGSFLDRLKQA